MPDPEFQKLFIVTGLALGGVYALSGVGMVVLYRATGVLNLAFGAVGALGALISWQLLQSTGTPNWLAYLACVAFGGVVTLVYGFVFGPLLAGRDPLVKAIGTVGLLLVFLGIMQWEWGDRNGLALTMPTTGWRYTLPGGLGLINWTQIIGMSFGLLMTAGTAAALRYTKIGTAMRSLANDREITATLGVPVRRVEAVAWLACGLVCGIAGLLLSNMLELNILTLTFFVIYAVAAALIARLHSIWITLVAAVLIGEIEAQLTGFHGSINCTDCGLGLLNEYRGMTPFVAAIVALLWFGRRRVLTVARVGR
jgi:branched-chain amino acid transport system permease protein